MAAAGFIDEQLTPLELRAVSVALEQARRYAPMPSVTVDDMRQEAQIRVWLMRRDSVGMSFENQGHHVAWLAKGARRAILDLRARAFRERRAGTGRAVDLDAMEPAAAKAVTDSLVDLADPLLLLKVNRAVAAIADMPPALASVAALSIEGHSNEHIAQILGGVHPSRVCQLRHQLVARLRRHLECIA
jgi:DNA-directed RNA polymerase specialized sigma24 family protein